MPREIPRARRVAEQVQRTLAQLLLREVRDPRLAPLTITHVRVSPDLTHAWVHYTLLAGDSHDPLQREILDEAAVPATTLGTVQLHGRRVDVVLRQRTPATNRTAGRQCLRVL